MVPQVALAPVLALELVQVVVQVEEEQPGSAQQRSMSTCTIGNCKGRLFVPFLLLFMRMD